MDSIVNFINRIVNTSYTKDLQQYSKKKGVPEETPLFLYST